MGKNPLCMTQFYKILSACRIPGLKKDSWECFPPDEPNSPTHITVIHNNSVRKLTTMWQGVLMGITFWDLVSKCRMIRIPFNCNLTSRFDHYKFWNI
jgi:hypothetical protein